ncbi:MAG: ROK family protein [Acidimicrobiales bacterium]
MTAIGLDVGGTKVLGVALDPAAPAQVVAEERVLTPEGGEGLTERLLALAAALGARAGTVESIGVGLPGLVDRTGTLHVGPHLRHISNLPLGARLADSAQVPVVVDNDANCHAVAEQAAGAAEGAQEALVVTLGTGIGAGIITGGRVLRGANGFAGEPGHMVVDPSGPPCPCGKRGCWERFASGTGLGRLARDAANGGRLDAAVDLAGGDPDAVRGEHVTAAARAGDREARAVLGELAHWIALGLANLANILDPEVIVVGGGLVEAADLLLPEVEGRFAGLVMAGDRRPHLPIVPATLGERAGAIGAALLVAEAT